MKLSREPVRWLYAAEAVLLALVALNVLTVDSDQLTAVLAAVGAIGGAAFGESVRAHVTPTARLGRPIRTEKGEDR